MVSEQSQLTVGELFAGIGGFSLGFHRAGFQVKWQVEIEPYCRKVLAKNFPEAERFEDVRTSGAANLCPVDVICGGFPCQDISVAGKGAGIDGERSGLWREFARIIGELRPRFVLVENVSRLLSLGMGRVLGDLAASGYDAEWDCIRAYDVGAPHLRDRIWIVAYPHGSGCTGPRIFGKQPGRAETIRNGEDLAHARCARLEKRVMLGGVSADASRADARKAAVLGGSISNSTSWREQCNERGFQDETVRGLGYQNNWETEPNVGRVADGVPSRVDRLRALGNAVVPQIPEWIAHRIIARAFLPHP